MTAIIFAQTSGTQSTGSSTWQSIPGLALTLPTTTTGTNALITLNLPNPYASGGDYPGASFAISVDDQVMTPIASFTASERQPDSSGRMPTTLIVEVRLEATTKQIKGMWSSVRNSTVVIDTPASLSAIVS
jgi:mannose-binding lectin